MVINRRADHPLAMLTKIYIEALLVDEELADLVWEASGKGEIDNHIALSAWWWIVVSGTHKLRPCVVFLNLTPNRVQAMDHQGKHPVEAMLTPKPFAVRYYRSTLVDLIRIEFQL